MQLLCCFCPFVQSDVEAAETRGGSCVFTGDSVKCHRATGDGRSELIFRPYGALLNVARTLARHLRYYTAAALQEHPVSAAIILNGMHEHVSSGGRENKGSPADDTRSRTTTKTKVRPACASCEAADARLDMHEKHRDVHRRE